MSAHTNFSAGQSHTYEEISSYYLELDRLLERVEQSTTHYQVLGLGRSAGGKQVRAAYQQALALLRPRDSIKALMSGETLSRVERAFERLSRSFNLLDNFGRRASHDSCLLQSMISPAAPEATTTLIVPPDVGLEPDNADLHRAMEIMFRPMPGRGRSGFPGGEAENRRRSSRYSLSIPARVTGVHRIDGMWHELAETFDVSDRGVGLSLRTSVRCGAVVHMSLPLPVKLRVHGHGDRSYDVYAVVRRVEPPDDGIRNVGLEFLGREAPSGYGENPWATFHIGKWQGVERRREPRVDRAEVVGIEYLDDRLNHIRLEVAVTENISPGGARVYLKAAPPDFSFVNVTNLNRSFKALATVRNRFVASDGFERLCLRFVDEKWPM